MNEPAGPMSRTCDCGYHYVLGSETSIYLFVNTPRYNHLRTQCRGCGRRITSWGLPDSVVQYLVEQNATPGNSIRLAVADKAPQSIIERWLAEFIGLTELSPQQEEAIALYGQVYGYSDDEAESPGDSGN